MLMPKNESDDLVFLAENAAATTEAVARTPAANCEQIAYSAYAENIRAQMNAAEKVEDLVLLEKSLQSLDRKFADSETDKTSIKSAIIDYATLSETIAQMRRSPDEYFKANLGIKEIGEDFRKQPRSRGIQQIDGNITRLTNRLTFGAKNKIPLWEVRLDVARRTKKLLINLHKELVAEYEKDVASLEQQARSGLIAELRRQVDTGKMNEKDFAAATEWINRTTIAERERDLNRQLERGMPR